MRFIRNIAAIILAGSTAAAASTSLPAAGKAETSRRWRAGQPIKIYVSNSLTKFSPNIKAGSDVLQAVRNSLAAWSDAADVSFVIEVTDRQSVSPAGVSGDGMNLITIGQTAENVLLFSREAPDAAAKTRVFSNKKGVITEGDVVLSPFQQFSTDGSYGTYDLQAVLIHEIGHMLGLSHSGVLGSVMFDRILKNAGDGQDVQARDLSDSDIAAVRDIYGTADLMDDCCSVVTGRLASSNGRAVKGLRVWAEEVQSGRVVGQAETSAEGTFRMGGISAGTYRILGRTKSGATDEIATIDLEPVEERDLTRPFDTAESKVSLDLVGVNGKLGESAIIVSRGDRHTVFVGGKDLDARSLTFTSNSKFLQVDAGSIVQQQTADGVSIVSFAISVDPETPRGIYSLFASAATSARSVLIGALSIR